MKFDMRSALHASKFESFVRGSAQTNKNYITNIRKLNFY